MSSSSDHQYHIRRVVLPSGKTIEVVYFKDPTGASAAERIPKLHVCPDCSCELVHPVAWEAVGPEHWEVELRCPNCERRATAVHPQAAVENLDYQLDTGTEALVKDLKRLTRANMEADIDRFVAALGSDLIMPEDF